MSLRTDPMLIVGLASLLSQGTSGIAPKDNRGPDAPSFKLVSIDKGTPPPEFPVPYLEVRDRQPSPGSAVSFLCVGLRRCALDKFSYAPHLTFIGSRRQGQRPSISSTNVQLRKVRTRTNPARMPRLVKVISIAMVFTMSAATRTSRPSSNDRPIRILYWS